MPPSLYSGKTFSDLLFASSKKESSPEGKIEGTNKNGRVASLECVSIHLIPSSDNAQSGQGCKIRLILQLDT